jgi:benzylsuccinate CoA-transferase BbsF subunit
MNPQDSTVNKTPVFALEGYRVLDFGTAWAGPMTAQLLADMGAEVIKAETRKRMDGLRMGRPIIGTDAAGGDEGKWPDMQTAFHALNRNKLSITLDLQDPEGHKAITKLVQMSDIVIDNSSPGVMKKLGLDHASLAAVNPGVITVSLTACGESGPLMRTVAYAPTITAVGGLNSLTGYQGENALYLMNVAYGDANASAHAVFAVLAALWHREETGEGQHIELSETEAVTSLLGEGFMELEMNGRLLGPQGNFHPVMCPHGIYRSQGDDKWIAIAINTDDEWRSFCKALDRKLWLEDERFRDKRERLKNASELDALITEWTIQHSPQDAMEMLQNVDVAATTVMNVEDQFLDVHYRERNTFEEIEHPLVGMEMLPGIPWKLSRTPGKMRLPAPSIGEHNGYVFGELLGYTPEEIAALEESKVIY